jgi:hypothetical protein
LPGQQASSSNKEDAQVAGHLIRDPFLWFFLTRPEQSHFTVVWGSAIVAVLVRLPLWPFLAFFTLLPLVFALF